MLVDQVGDSPSLFWLIYIKDTCQECSMRAKCGLADFVGVRSDQVVYRSRHMVIYVFVCLLQFHHTLGYSF